VLVVPIAVTQANLLKVEYKDVQVGLMDVDYVLSVQKVVVDLCSTGWLP
tara:strand:+ start:260 stop:406 length:147 start_codon:yes stop_codon:yes gene_type:complete